MNTGVVLAAGIGGNVLGLLFSFHAPRCWLAFALLSASMSLLAALGIFFTGLEWEWKSLFSIGGESLHLRLDGISAMFLALVAILGGVGAFYSQKYWFENFHPVSGKLGRFWWNALLLCMSLLLLNSNGLHFLICWELFTICAYFLITLDGQKREVRKAGWLYLAASHTGTLALFAFFSLLASGTGSWDLGPMRDRPEFAPLFWLALFGFGLKAGLFPLHIWLPSAHANAPSHVSAILSGVAIKMGIYGIVRFSGWISTSSSAGWVVVVLGVESAVLGVVFALGQHDIKRLLAYHSVENIGIILIGVGFAMVAASNNHPAWGGLALAGGLLHVWNHGLFKSLLFFGAGSVHHATHTREMSRLGGLWQRMPWTASLFALGAAAISGLPPLNGFISEWLLYLGMFDAINHPKAPILAAVPAVILLAMTGALALACFVKACSIMFLGAPRSQVARNAHESSSWMLGPMVVLASLCLAIGLAPALFWPVLKNALTSWNGSWTTLHAPESLSAISIIHVSLLTMAIIAASLLWRRSHRNCWRRSVTWDCGYASPSARMQYSAGSFASIIKEWFAWILFPERHEKRPDTPFPRSASCEEHTPETVLECVVEPFSRSILKISGMVRRLQNGRTHAYILYLIFGLAAVATMILAWVR